MKTGNSESRMSETEAGMVLNSSRTLISRLIFSGREEFPVEVLYKDKRYLLVVTKNDKLMLQKAV